jgi:anti-anti-sigma regulatory factor
MLKIERQQMEEDTVQFTLSGRLQVTQVSELRELIRSEVRRVVLDLREIRLVDRGAIEFLAACERDGVALRNCSPYIREWVTREANRTES